MTKRKGLGKGKGKGYKNLAPKDPKVHKDSAMGRKQPQNINMKPQSYILKCDFCRKKFPTTKLVSVCPSCDKKLHPNPLKDKKMTEHEYQEELNELLWEQRNNCPECMDMKMQGIAGCCQYHLDKQMELYNKMHPDEDSNPQSQEEFYTQEQEPEMEDYEEPNEEWYSEGTCINCGCRYNMSDMSPDYVKGGCCSQGCAEAKGFFGTRLKGEDVPDDRFNQDDLLRGTKVEMEHTDDPAIAKKIAKAHLLEFPDYYERLDKLEEQAKKKWG